MDNYFDKAVHFLGKNNPNIFIMNIGAMDGVMFDELIGYTNMYNFKGLYVEPITYNFEKLKNNIPNEGNFFENSAISDYNGEIEMITIDKEVIDQGLVHSCFYGMSAVYPPKNGLGSEFDKPTVEKYGQKINVKCITLDKLLRKHRIEHFDIIKVDAEGHDYVIFKQIDFDEFRPKVVRLEWINLTSEEQTLIKNKFDSVGYKYEISGQDIVGLPEEFFNELSSYVMDNNINVDSVKVSDDKIITPITNNSKTTIVTGLWDIGRNELTSDWSRSFSHYLKKFDEFLKIPNNLIIFGDEKLREFVFERRSPENTHFILKDLSWFTNNDFFHKIQAIRTNPQWYNQVGWLKDSTQAKLEMYNPLVMSKMFLLHDAKILDNFDSEYMFWLDAGITNTVHPGYFTHDLVLEKVPKLTNKFMFVTFPYETNTEIHGFKFDDICRYAKENVNKVARAGFFGGKKDSISEINTIYYGLLQDTLSNNLMGTEESLFTIMTYLYPQLIDTFSIEYTGLIGKFFEDVKNNSYDDRPVELPKIDRIVNESLPTEETALYVIGFNSPNQFKTLIHSMMSYDKNFIDKPKKYLLNNSTDLSTTDQYVALCTAYGFEHIKKDNIGITGGRQWIAEHFNDSNHKYYFFFEDDMFFSDDKMGHCRNGFSRYSPNLYDKLIKLMNKEKFDFIKMNYSEFFGDNGTQWAWYNVPQAFRQVQWPNNQKLPVQGLDPNSPRTKYNTIQSLEGLPYATGEVFYCNWPQIMSKDGNRKCFIDTKFASPYEQTIMSFIFQETIKGIIKPAILMLTPTDHNRFEHYAAELRKEC